MALFDLELYLPGITTETVGELAARVRAAAAELDSGGRPVRYLAASLSLHDEVCFVRIEGSRPDVDELVRRCGLVGVRVSEVVIVRGSRAPR